LFDLKSFLPKKPGEAELRIIKEMFDASVDGKPYDNERWGQYYRPWGVDAPAGTSAPASDAPPAAKAPENGKAKQSDCAWEDDVKAAEAPVVVPKTSGDRTADILALIKARQTKTV
jgi:hypothetical protein